MSVIIPTWNRAGTLVSAIESALMQEDAGRLEILVCDDGSDDDSRARVASLGDARVRLVEGPRSGRPAVPRNRGIMHSRGEWLAFLDSDDAWFPGKLSRQLEGMAELGCRASCTSAVAVRPDGTRTVMSKSSPEPITFTDLLRGNLVVCSSVVLHRSLLARIGGFPQHPDLTAIEDYALWLRAASITRFAYVAEPLVAYTDAPTSSLRAHDVRSSMAQQDLAFDDFLHWASPLSGRAVTVRLARSRRRIRAFRQRMLDVI